MRTAIYVYQPTHVTFRPTGPTDVKLPLFRFQHFDERPAIGTLRLVPGIYAIASDAPVDVTGDHIEVIPLAGKDDNPDPKARVLALEPGATAESVRDFLMIDKDVSPDD
jgi:hypothetical protein